MFSNSFFEKACLLEFANAVPCRLSSRKRFCCFFGLGSGDLGRPKRHDKTETPYLVGSLWLPPERFHFGFADPPGRSEFHVSTIFSKKCFSSHFQTPYLVGVLVVVFCLRFCGPNYGRSR